MEVRIKFQNWDDWVEEDIELHIPSPITVKHLADHLEALAKDLRDLPDWWLIKVNINDD